MVGYVDPGVVEADGRTDVPGGEGGLLGGVAADEEDGGGAEDVAL